MDKTTLRYSHTRYDELLNYIFNDVRQLAKLKGDEYAHGGDRLDNFRRNAADCGVTMETCWRIYIGKHWDAISQYVRDIQSGVERERMESIRGRAMDMIVYLTLFIAMVEEREGLQKAASAPTNVDGGPFGGKIMPHADYNPNEFSEEAAKKLMAKQD